MFNYNKSNKYSNYMCCCSFIPIDKSVKICTFLLILLYIGLTIYSSILYIFLIKLLYVFIYLLTVITLCALLIGIKKKNEKYLKIYLNVFSFCYGFSIATIFIDLCNRFISIFTAGRKDEIYYFRQQHSNYSFIKNYSDNEITKTIRYLAIGGIIFHIICISILTNYILVTNKYASNLIDSIRGEFEFRQLEEDDAWE
ncbi:hypothetical protein H8356DRAFT_1704440 [Neocallimastix lanati (nom. inval.)]|uniref:Uncharacterized protein n=1 Tax=Neocallimastix californiae TaxID=1754190 RepID=A0A1Y2AGY9_9FUNG|nr:hypothetical protein H8356DRAFT_1704440 [Neocallimastix sp. JGI-2020a]ORY21821.1 hypothetical protein LY90DRAFT_136392 [Neocallimastix californiae]|eukprot:ORY21821.1 hypothetical protein LY90DRAFT_136392 [Neocallimastix californiae]